MASKSPHPGHSPTGSKGYPPGAISLAKGLLGRRLADDLSRRLKKGKKPGDYRPPGDEKD